MTYLCIGEDGKKKFRFARKPMRYKEEEIKTSRKNALKQVQQALQLITRGKFIQISRYSERCELSMVAHRFTGDKERFEQIIYRAYEDAADAVMEDQWLKIEITD
jgi:hypothetical protein